jgi:hypothetical protein
MKVMADTIHQPATSPKPPAPLQDALDTWTAETGSAGPANVAAVRVDGNEKLLILFTTSMARVRLHFLDAAALRSFVHCAGGDCLLCRAGRQTETRDLLPVYDAVAQAVAVLPVSPSLRPQALRPQLAPALRQVKDGARLVLSVRKVDNVRFAVGTFPLPDDADDGADKIGAFVEQINAGTIDLGAAFPRLGAEELAAIPEVASALRMKGIHLP